MRIVECMQGSDLWWEARRGLPTASAFGRIMTPKKQKPSGGQDKYINELIADRVCLMPNYFTSQGKPVTRSMQEGIDREPEARGWYELEYGVAVVRVGFCLSDCGRWGASPDGLVGEDGGLELKVPDLDTHIGYLRKGVLPTEYLCQVHGSLIVTGRKWWDFMSYPVVAADVKPFVIRVEPDSFTDRLREELEKFHKRYMAEIARLTGQPAPLSPPPTAFEFPFTDVADVETPPF